MTSETIDQMCRGRFVPIPDAENSTREQRIEIMCGNVRVMMEELGHVPLFYPQSDIEVPSWIDEKDQSVALLRTALRFVARQPDDVLFPSPFIV